MRRTAHQYARAWHNALCDKPAKEWKTISRAFLLHLYKTGELSMLPDIIRILTTVVSAESGITRAIITTAKETDKQTIAEILTKLFGDKKIQSTHRVDETIIGGFVVQTEERRWNGSLSGTLTLLKKHLIQ